MKRIVLIAMMLLGIASLAQAQRGSGQRPSQAPGHQRQQMNPEQMADRQIQRLNEALTLSDAQKTKLKEIFKQNSEKQRELFSGMRGNGEQGDRDKMREKMNEFRKKQDEQIKAILTKDQLPKYEKYLKEREAKMKERMNNGGQRGGNR